MRLREFINEASAYKKVESEIKAWVEQSYPGLSIEFNWPAPEIVQTNPKRRFTPLRVQRITEAVNIKIGEIMENHAEEIYIAERLERIYKNHPHFDFDVQCMKDIKTNPLFLEYLKELVITE